MALNANGLKSAMLAKATEAGFESITQDLDRLIGALATATVEYISANAEVTITKAVTSVTGGSGAPAVGVITPFTESGAIS